MNGGGADSFQNPGSAQLNDAINQAQSQGGLGGLNLSKMNPAMLGAVASLMSGKQGAQGMSNPAMMGLLAQLMQGKQQ